MDLEYGADILRVYSGGRIIANSQLLQEWTYLKDSSTHETPLIVPGVNNFLLIQLVSDSSVNASGITASWMPGKLYSRKCVLFPSLEVRRMTINE